MEGVRPKRSVRLFELLTFLIFLTLPSPFRAYPTFRFARTYPLIYLPLGLPLVPQHLCFIAIQLHRLIDAASGQYASQGFLDHCVRVV